MSSQVRNLSRRLAQIQAQLQAAVLDDFKSLMGQADVKLSPENLDRLANACLVVDALGAKVDPPCLSVCVCITVHSPP